MNTHLAVARAPTLPARQGRGALHRGSTCQEDVHGLAPRVVIVGVRRVCHLKGALEGILVVGRAVGIERIERSVERAQRVLVAQVDRNRAVHLGGEEVHWGCWLSPELVQRAQIVLSARDQRTPTTVGSWQTDIPHRLYEYFVMRLHNKILTPGHIRAMDHKRVIVWEDVLFEAPEWTAANLSRSRTIVEVFKRPRWDRMSVFNATALGFDVICTNVDDWYLDFGRKWQRRWKFEPLEENLRRPWAPNLPLSIPDDSEQAERVLGGEVGCWGKCTSTINKLIQSASTQETDSALDGMLAVAERLWVARSVRDADCAERRLRAAKKTLLRMGY